MKKVLSLCLSAVIFGSGFSTFAIDLTAVHQDIRGKSSFDGRSIQYAALQELEAKLKIAKESNFNSTASVTNSVALSYINRHSELASLVPQLSERFNDVRTRAMQLLGSMGIPADVANFISSRISNTSFSTVSDDQTSILSQTGQFSLRENQSSIAVSPGMVLVPVINGAGETAAMQQFACTLGHEFGHYVFSLSESTYKSQMHSQNNTILMWDRETRIPTDGKTYSVITSITKDWLSSHGFAYALNDPALADSSISEIFADAFALFLLTKTYGVTLEQACESLIKITWTPEENLDRETAARDPHLFSEHRAIAASHLYEQLIERGIFKI
jgi:hypothetical protein